MANDSHIESLFEDLKKESKTVKKEDTSIPSMSFQTMQTDTDKKVLSLRERIEKAFSQSQTSEQTAVQSPAQQQMRLQAPVQTISIQDAIPKMQDSRQLNILESHEQEFMQEKEKAAIASQDVKFVSTDENGKKLVEEYGDAKIYKKEGDAEYKYEIPTPTFRGEEKQLIKDLVEISSKVITVDASVFKSKQELKEQYFKRVMEVINAAPELRVPPNAKEFYAKIVVQEIIGYGLIDPLLDDDKLEEIMIIGPGKPIYVVHRKYGVMLTNIVYYDDKDIRGLIDKFARQVGRRIDVQSPFLDARLADGTRVNATVPPASIDGSTVTLRKFKKDPLSIINLIKLRTLDSEAAAFLWLACDGMGVKPANVLVAGGTGSGKTSTLNVLTSFVPIDERIITMEDVAELNLPLPHWIRMESRPKGLEGTGEISMNDLVKNSLRMRPDRIIVGEIRGEEGFTLFSAMNTGHNGSCGTVHSNSARETVTRLISPPISIPIIMISALNFIIMQQRMHDRQRGIIRRITEIVEVTGIENDEVQMETIYRWQAQTDELIRTDKPVKFLQELSELNGMSIEAIYDEIQVRRNILEELVKRDVTGLEEVCKITQEYVIRKMKK